MKSLIEESVSLFQLSTAKTGLTIEFLVEGNVPDELMGDPFRLRQILTNLIGNAVKYTKKGRIYIYVNKIGEQGNGKIVLQFVVKDSGIGIPPHKRDVLFKSFSQVDNSNTRQYGGSGLGLSICKGLVEKMNGEIWVEPNEKEGSSFYFTCVLDKCTNLVSTITPTAENTEYPNGKSLKLLIVEDDEISGMFLKKIAERKGWTCSLVRNGEEAVKVFNTDNFSIIIMDVQMPIMDGYTATKMIRQLETTTNSRIPIIAMTAFALMGCREKCLEAGMDEYISKPVDINKFSEIVLKWVKNK